jgi:acyl-homoserine lactone acylase PvdQ
MFYTTLLKEQIDDASVRLAMTGNYPFADFVQRMLATLIEDPENERFNRVCRGGYAEYSGKKACVYNIIRSVADAYDFLKKEVSEQTQDWEWGRVHVNEYPHIPFSLSPLKTLFHRESPIGGNGNTVKVSKYSMKRSLAIKSFKSTHTPNYKQIVQFSDNLTDQKMLYSFDGGQSGNLFAGHYFDFNKNHLDGTLMEAVIGRAGVELKKHTTLAIKPLSQ